MNRISRRRLLIALLALILTSPGGVSGHKLVPKAALLPKTPPLLTPWTSQASTTSPLPDYPRPQMVRGEWQNLNGWWQFARATAGQRPPFGQNLAESVLVPFPIESALSGIRRHETRMWYRRIFNIPSEWNGRRVLLNFGAVDWKATVYVNGRSVGTHSGGYDSFSFDTTSALKGGANELIVGVYDPTDDDGMGQPIGKQRTSPDGIFYTAASGIWQTVWLEPVPAAHITRLEVTPDISGQILTLTVLGADINGQTVRAVASSGGVQVGSATGGVGSAISIPVPNPHLWSPDDPFLYGLRVSLVSGSTTVDQVTSYFGMRSITLAMVGGILRPVLNGQFVFQLGTLDQGYWPDGIYTAPTDDALKFDIQKHKDLGFNTIRKHMKIEPQRWYYWADRLGILVWQDVPAMFGRPPTMAQREQFETELRALVDQHRGAPSIVVWVVFNEGWGQYDNARLADTLKGWDPSRLVDYMSGINCCGAVDSGDGDVSDWHVYNGPASPVPTPRRAAVLGEFGGVELPVTGHEWRPSNSVSHPTTQRPDAAALTDRYVELIRQIRALVGSPGLSGAIYTQFTDVETELNGLLTYDRAIVKPDVTRVRNANIELIAISRGPK